MDSSFTYYGASSMSLFRQRLRWVDNHPVTVADVKRNGANVVYQSQTLSQQDFDHWVEKNPLASTSGEDSTNFRVILGPSSADNSKQLKLTFNHNRLRYPEDCVPFSGSTFRYILDALDLSVERTMWCLSTDSTHFHVYRSGPLDNEDEPDSMEITMRMASLGILKMDARAIISYNPRKALVSALLQGCSFTEATKVSDLLRRFQLLAIHPLLLPYVLASLKYEEMHRESRHIWELLLLVESKSRQTGAPRVDWTKQAGGSQGTLNPKAQSIDEEQQLPAGTVGQDVRYDFDTLTRATVAVLQRASYAESHAQALLTMLEGMQKETRSMARRSGVTLGMEATANAGSILSSMLELLAQQTTILLSHLGFLHKRGESQQSAVYNLIAMHEARISSDIARASKRDSSAMKGIAVLTMFFLPGTCLATLFAMPVFDFNTDTSTPSIKSTFWLYWAVAGPLTTLVLALYITYELYVDRKRRHEDQREASVPSTAASDEPVEPTRYSSDEGGWAPLSFAGVGSEIAVSGLSDGSVDILSRYDSPLPSPSEWSAMRKKVEDNGEVPPPAAGSWDAVWEALKDDSNASRKRTKPVFRKHKGFAVNLQESSSASSKMPVEQSGSVATTFDRSTFSRRVRF
ncbi:hypothetical protein B0H63DRAFT_76154 [Podospora didyma]|uniref:Uncharacterized protein n=1 Tax=Podospora didyma TaxID=330526 RepID=A0AAE0N2L4_9PEZI|nr:hypothetical protein B0H63DRAFT_76154 [Podospora didyma]